MVLGIRDKGGGNEILCGENDGMFDRVYGVCGN